MSAKLLRAFTSVTVLATAAAVSGCVADRPSRNQVDNAQQYIRKDFLVQSGTGGGDPGWFMQAAVVQTSTPNPLGAPQVGLFQGALSSASNPGATFVHFVITQDELEMVNNLEISGTAASGSADTRTGEVLNAWDITNVDLMYQVDLDGEKSNVYYASTENAWQLRQWVQVNFDKSDFGDLSVFGAQTQAFLNQCANGSGASTTLVPNSLLVDTDNEYMEFTVNVTVPVTPFDANGTAAQQACAQMFGATGQTFQSMGRNNVTANVKYSFVRPEKLEPPSVSYTPLAIQEKDPIQHKYGVLQIDPIFRDYQSGLLGANQLGVRWNPSNADTPVTFYFVPGTPQKYMDFMAKGSGSIQAQTNAIFAAVGAKSKIQFLNYNDATSYMDGLGTPRNFGDVRYSFINWHDDIDSAPDSALGVAQQFTDPRSGQLLSATVNVWAYAIQDDVVDRLTFYLQTLGQDPTGQQVNPSGQVYPPTTSCSGGQVIPLVASDVLQLHDSTSTVFAKMQAYMGKPNSQYGNLGPADFIVDHSQDLLAPGQPESAANPNLFWPAFYTTVPYNVYADPNSNPFVTPNGGSADNNTAGQQTAIANVASFTSLATSLDQGNDPIGIESPDNLYAAATNFSAQWQSLASAVQTQQYLSRMTTGTSQYEMEGAVSYLNVFQKAGLQCVQTGSMTATTPAGIPQAVGTSGGVWQTYDAYTSGLVDSLYEALVLHEFGHALGLRHNFMGSVDQKNFLYEDSAQTIPGLYSSSIMDYNVAASESYFTGQYTAPNGTKINNGGPGWGPYDIAALGWIYGNDQDAQQAATQLQNNSESNFQSYSGQASSTAPWNDPFGFDSTGKVENIFLYCSDEHTLHTPFCRPYDLGTTPSEIVANAIDNYEWQYHWSNYRLYRKIWSEQNYTANVTTAMNDMLRWSAAWAVDWNVQSLLQYFEHLNIVPPPGANTNDYFLTVANEFSTDISVANQMVAAFYNAVVFQASGERPYATTFDPFYGDVTQQGIAVDKIAAISAFNSLTEQSKYEDPTQGQALYFTPISLGTAVQDTGYQAVAELAAENMAGAGFNIYPYETYVATAAFANTTHSILFAGRTELRDWIGGQVFYRFEDFLNYVRELAAESANAAGWQCPYYNAPNCLWDPTQQQPGNDTGCPSGSACPQYLNFSSSTNEFVGPDGRNYIWASIPDRNEYILSDRDRNPVAYATIKNYTADLVQSQDDGTLGNGILYTYEMNMKALLDFFEVTNSTIGDPTPVSN